MAEEIKRSDIAEDDVFSAVTESIKKSLAVLREYDKGLKQTAETLKKISETPVTSDAKSLDELNQAVKDAKKATEEKIAADKNRAKLEQELTALQKKRAQMEAQMSKEQKTAVNWNVKVDKSYEKVIGSLDQNLKRLSELKKRREDLNKQAKQTTTYNAKLVKEQASVKEAISQLNIITKQQIKAQDLAAGSSQQLQTQLGLMRRAYRELNDEERQSEFGQKLFSQIQVARQAVESTNESIGNFHDSVGNYAKGVQDAIGQTNMFKTGIAGIDNILAKIIPMMVAFTFSVDKNKKAQEGAAVASSRLSKSIKTLGRVAKASGLILILAAVASIGSAFSQGDEGAKKMAETMAYIKALGSTIVQMFSQLYTYLNRMVLGFQKIGLQIERLTLRALFKDTTEIDKSLEKIDGKLADITTKIDAFPSLMETWRRSLEENKEAAQAFVDTFDIRRQIVQTKQGLHEIQKEFQKYNDLTNDSTLSLERRMEAMKKTDDAELRLIKARIAMAKQEQKLAEAEAKALEAAAKGGGSVEAFEKRQEAQDKVNDLLLEEAAILRAQARVTREKIIEEYQLNISTALAVTRFNRDQLKERIDDERLSNEERIKLSKEFVKTFTQSIEQTFSEFTEASKKLDAAVDLQLKDGKIFLNQQELQINNAVELQKQLALLDLPKSMIESLLDYSRRFRMNINAISDVENAIAGIDTQLRKIKADASVSDEELAGLKRLNSELERLNEITFSSDGSDLEAIQKQRKAVVEAMGEIDEEVLKNTENANIERLKLNIDTWKEEIEATEGNSIERATILKEIANAEIEIEKIKNAQLLREKKKQDDEEKRLLKEKEEREKKALENQKEMYASLKTATSALTQFYQGEQQKQINALNTQIKEQQGLRNALSQMAAEGNIDAKESIKETIEAEREAEKEKLRIEERKQRMQLISQGLQSYISALENGKSPVEALTQTAMTTAMLMSFLGGLKGFYTGTDNAPEGLAWTQERGAEIIMDKHGNIKTLGSDGGSQLTHLNKGDKVLNAKRTQEFIKSITEVQNLSSMPRGTSVAPDVNLLAIKKLSQIEKAIRSQPTTTLDFENVRRGLGSLVHSRAQGKDKVISRHYIKR